MPNPSFVRWRRSFSWRGEEKAFHGAFCQNSCDKNLINLWRETTFLESQCLRSLLTMRRKVDAQYKTYVPGWIQYNIQYNIQYRSEESHRSGYSWAPVSAVARSMCSPHGQDLQRPGLCLELCRRATLLGGAQYVLCLHSLQFTFSYLKMNE